MAKLSQQTNNATGRKLYQCHYEGRKTLAASVYRTLVSIFDVFSYLTSINLTFIC